MARMTGAKAGAAAVLALLVSSSSAFTAPASALSMRTGAVTSQPIGHYEFCQTHKSECRAGVRNLAPAKVTSFGWTVVRKINASVNRDIAPMTDRDLYGKDEFWAYPDKAGDCEDFVLLKRRKLIEKGWPTAALLITVVRQSNGDGHAVLSVTTNQGDLVLDNLDAEIKLWSETSYRYLKRQSEYDSGAWMGIEDDRSEALVSSLR